MREGKSEIFTSKAIRSYSDFDHLSYWMHLASSTVFHGDTISYQPECDDEQLQKAISAFEEMLYTIHLISSDLGVIMVYVDNREVTNQMAGIGDLFHLLGTLGNQLQQIRGDLDHAYNMRLSGKYTYLPKPWETEEQQ